MAPAHYTGRVADVRQELKMWDLVRLIEAEVAELRTMAHAAGEPALEHALKTIDRAFQEQGYREARPEGDKWTGGLVSLRNQLEHELGSAQGQFKHLRQREEELEAESMQLRSENEELRAQLAEEKAPEEEPEEKPPSQHWFKPIGRRR